jgi:hypothetical protein
MTRQHSVPDNLLELAIGLSIEILSNDYNELLSSSGEALSHHNIVFQIEADSPDTLSIAVLFALSLMSFTYASPVDPQTESKVVAYGGADTTLRKESLYRLPGTQKRDCRKQHRNLS